MSHRVNTPQQNGVAERNTQALWFQQNVPKAFWEEVVLIATHLINRLTMRVLGLEPSGHPFLLLP